MRTKLLPGAAQAVAWLERDIPGQEPEQIRLESFPFTLGRNEACDYQILSSRVSREHAEISRRGGKHLLYVLVSATIAHLFIAYFLSIPQLWSMMRAAPGEHWTVFLFVALFTGVLYFNFAWFREQLCVIICPYGRLQSALIDDHSLVIGYDEKRGEPRGKLVERRRRGGRNCPKGRP